MKTTFRFFGLSAQPTWCCLVEQQLKDLQSLTGIFAAEVVLERQSGVCVAFRVQVMLEGSPWDLQAEATEHTRQAALLKAIQNLECQIRSRKTTPVAQRELSLQLNPISSR